MIKRKTLLACCSILLLLGCSDDESNPALTTNESALNLEIEDIGNVNDASDVGVSLAMDEIEAGEEIRILLVNNSSIPILSTELLNDLSAENYHTITATSSVQYEVQLPSNLNDITGAKIREGVDYSAYAYFPGSNSISRESNVLELEQVAVLNGTYVGQLSFLAVVGSLEIKLTGELGSDKYSGTVKLPGLAAQPPWDASVYMNISMTVSGNNVTDFSITNSSTFLDNVDQQFSCPELGAVFVGQGGILGFSNMQIDISGQFCDGSPTSGNITMARRI
ncbi:MAG: hypothetical protein RJQ09_17965 [Cyclobacteriaceae bacterium]